MHKYLSLTAFLILVFAIAAVSSYVTMPAVEGWYQHIRKPAWDPPDGVFGPVWTLLYIMIAFAGWRAWQKLLHPRAAMHPTMQAYWLQLFFNFLWSILFFGLHQPRLAMIDITLLVIAIVFTIRSFMPLDKTAAWLLVPYLFWVIYASTLNMAIVVLN